MHLHFGQGIQMTGRQLHATNAGGRSGGGPRRGSPIDRRRYWLFIHYTSRAESNSHLAFAENEQVAGGLDEKTRRLEAVLFLAPEGLSSRKLAKLAGLADATEARTLIRQLCNQLDQAGHCYRVEEVAGGYALRTRSQFAPWLRRLAHVPGDLRLSQPALETLAIVAYRQPVLRANIEAIRGVGCSEVLKQLMEMELIRISGRSEDLGRPYLYGTTRRFLQMFGLRSADRLPRIDWVNSPEISLSSQNSVERDSATKESTVNMSFSATVVNGERSAILEDTLLNTVGLAPAAVDSDEDFLEDEESDADDEEFDDDDDEFEDDDWEDDDDADDEVEDDVEEDDVEEDDEEDEDEDDEDDGEWEEVDDDDDWDEDDEEDDDWDDEDDEDDDDWD